MRQFVIGHDALRQIAADAADDGTRLGHAGFASGSGIAGGSLAAIDGKAPHAFADLVDQAAARHLVGEAERALEADLVGAAMALDDDAVEAEEHAAIDGARIELAAQRVERLAGEQRADAAESRSALSALRT